MKLQATLYLPGLAALVAACAGPGQPPVELGPHKGPVVIASSARCAAEQSNLALIVGEDARRLKSLLRAEVVLADAGFAQGPPTESAIKNAVTTSTDDRGLFVVYSGHGQKVDATSNVCVYSEDHSQGVPIPASTLLSVASSTDTNATPPPWAVLLLNSCESAFLDLRLLGRPTTVISTAHKEVSASLQSHTIGGGGTVVTQLLTNILSGNDERTMGDDQPGGPDANCDGILTDYELFGRLVTELARVYPDTGPNPPVFNLRRASRTHIPLPLDGEPRASKACKKDSVRQGISQFIVSLQSTDVASVELKEQLSHQMKLAEDLRTSAETHRLTPYPTATHDFFLTDPPDPALDQEIQQEGLVRFPGTREQAELVANYAIFTEIYLFAPDGTDRVRVLSLRREPAPFREERTAGLRLLRNLERTRMASFVRGLARRVLVIDEADNGKLVLLVTDRVDGTPLKAETSKGPIRIDPQRLTLVPCEEGEGQCFEYNP